MNYESPNHDEEHLTFSRGNREPGSLQASTRRAFVADRIGYNAAPFGQKVHLVWSQTSKAEKAEKASHMAARERSCPADDRNCPIPGWPSPCVPTCRLAVGSTYSGRPVHLGPASAPAWRWLPDCGNQLPPGQRPRRNAWSTLGLGAGVPDPDPGDCLVLVCPPCCDDPVQAGVVWSGDKCRAAVHYRGRPGCWAPLAAQLARCEAAEARSGIRPDRACGLRGGRGHD